MIIINRYAPYGQGGVFHVKDLIENRLASSTMDLGGRNNLFRTKSEAQKMCDQLNDLPSEKQRKKELVIYLQKVINALIAFRNAHSDLSRLWNQEPKYIDLNETKLGGNLYPFDKSFDDLKIQDWYEASVEELIRYRDELQGFAYTKV